MSSSEILERGETGTKCKFQGILLFRDSEPRVWSQNAEVQSSPKRARKNSTALDIVLCDKTGPMCVTLFGDDLVAQFLQDLQGSVSQAKTIDLSVARIAELKKDTWNGAILTRIRFLQTIASIGSRAGTVLTLLDAPTSPYMVSGVYPRLSKESCIRDFSSMRSQLLANFRATFEGTIADVEDVDFTQQGDPKRIFKLVDGAGSYIQCCALGNNVESIALVPNQIVVLYFGTGRGPIGSAPGMVYLRKDSIIVPMRMALFPPAANNQIEIMVR